MKKTNKKVRLTEVKIHFIMKRRTERTEIMKKFLDDTTWKFILVGIINTVIGTGVMFLCYNFLHFSYWISSSANYMIGSIVSYFLNKYFTFQKKEKSFREILRFIMNILICYLAAYGMAKPFAAALLRGWPVQVQENAAMLTGMCFFVALNYLGQRFYVFRKKEDQ